MSTSAEHCNHGVTFDEAEAKRLYQKLRDEGPYAELNVSYEVRRRWPRLFGECPKGCGFNGIAYASVVHFAMGNW